MTHWGIWLRMPRFFNRWNESGRSFRVLANAADDAPRADIARAPVAGAERFDADDTGRVRGMNEAIAANRDGDVRRAVASSLRVEKDQIAGLDFGGLHLVADLPLLLDDARHGDAVLREDVLHQPAAIEPSRIGATKTVGHAPKSQRELRDGPAVEPAGEEVGCDGGDGCVRSNRCVRCGYAPVRLSHPSHLLRPSLPPRETGGGPRRCRTRGRRETRQDDEDG